MPTLIFREILQVDQYREVIARFGGHNIGSILALQHCLRAILHQFWEAFHGYRNEDLGLHFGSGDVEGYVIEVGNDLVD
jgi:hypothetical protein